ncbi:MULTISPECIES: hypothetical protein [Streptomyces]|jgi:hypothetical protein|uniref:hypothetical protein n=1 Tax=Streptomyces TaxID=1883 RepID=UPI0011633E85|nr:MULTISPECIES: hypothetical protein [Streptomyces]MCX4611969.1 hypothetical protein [Streptomyces mirabilis]MCX5352215.1 hypothetical protein [Streptomyces mirabilis]QDN90342.1 hypothetical protein FNV61_36460 [Streptomyces sp. RLB3-6]QDO11188.1 hypothetical protein FNV68_37630 [Streptomyces sp. S1D4-23]
MFEYELQQMRSNELIREAQDHRQAQEALRGRRAARRAAARESGQNDSEGQAHSPRPRRHRFARAA